MTPSQVREVCSKYAAVLDGLGASSVENQKAESREGKLSHLRWMCDHIVGLVRTDQPFDTDTSISNREKAMRWLGFVQGAMSVLDIRTIDEMRDDNR